jgi:hypothetical protein
LGQNTPNIVLAFVAALEELVVKKAIYNDNLTEGLVHPTGTSSRLVSLLISIAAIVSLQYSCPHGEDKHQQNEATIYFLTEVQDVKTKDVVHEIQWAQTSL